MSEPTGNAPGVISLRGAIFAIGSLTPKKVPFGFLMPFVFVTENIWPNPLPFALTAANSMFELV